MQSSHSSSKIWEWRSGNHGRDRNKPNTADVLREARKETSKDDWWQQSSASVHGFSTKNHFSQPEQASEAEPPKENARPLRRPAKQQQSSSPHVPAEVYVGVSHGSQNARGKGTFIKAVSPSAVELEGSASTNGNNQNDSISFQFSENSVFDLQGAPEVYMLGKQIGARVHAKLKKLENMVIVLSFPDFQSFSQVLPETSTPVSTQEGLLLPLLSEAFGELGDETNEEQQPQLRVTCAMLSDGEWVDALGYIVEELSLEYETILWYSDPIQLRAHRERNHSEAAIKLRRACVNSMRVAVQLLMRCFARAIESDTSMLVFDFGITGSGTVKSIQNLKLVAFPVSARQGSSGKGETSYCWQEFEEISQQTYETAHIGLFQRARNNSSVQSFAEAIGLDSSLLFCSLFSCDDQFDSVRRLLLVSDALRYSKSFPVMRSTRVEALISMYCQLIVSAERKQGESGTSPNQHQSVKAEDGNESSTDAQREKRLLQKELQKSNMECQRLRQRAEAAGVDVDGNDGDVTSAAEKISLLQQRIVYLNHVIADLKRDNSTAASHHNNEEVKRLSDMYYQQLAREQQLKEEVEYLRNRSNPQDGSGIQQSNVEQVRQERDRYYNDAEYWRMKAESNSMRVNGEQTRSNEDLEQVKQQRDQLQNEVNRLRGLLPPTEGYVDSYREDRSTDTVSSMRKRISSLETENNKLKEELRAGYSSSENPWVEQLKQREKEQIDLMTTRALLESEIQQMKEYHRRTVKLLKDKIESMKTQAREDWT
eukprot:gb/GECG01002795.1/.p1 GENE.gb/GECG01002795.1/~~gb/GECG01002795.1/.p1  ORF type:complete len:767 (+),score=121.94 gb/GECG01002795.1/:1-2301(+)